MYLAKRTTRYSSFHNMCTSSAHCRMLGSSTSGRKPGGLGSKSSAVAAVSSLDRCKIHKDQSRQSLSAKTLPLNKEAGPVGLAAVTAVSSLHRQCSAQKGSSDLSRIGFACVQQQLCNTILTAPQARSTLRKRRHNFQGPLVYCYKCLRVDRPRRAASFGWVVTHFERHA